MPRKERAVYLKADERKLQAAVEMLKWMKENDPERGLAANDCLELLEPLVASIVEPEEKPKANYLASNGH